MQTEQEQQPTRRFAIRGWDVVRVALGVLLLAAAGLKLAGPSVSPLPNVGWYSSAPVQIAALEWEAILAVWLLLGWYQIISWIASLTTFVGFAFVSGYLGWTGVCNCR